MRRTILYRIIDDWLIEPICLDEAPVLAGYVKKQIGNYIYYECLKLPRSVTTKPSQGVDRIDIGLKEWTPEFCFKLRMQQSMVRLMW